MGKRTSVIYPDFDCVVFLNTIEPPLDSVLETFENILRENAEELRIIPDSIKRTWITVMVRFDNGVEMDLLAACNLSNQNPRAQHNLVIERIKQDVKKSPLYSSSLAEMQLDYLKSQSGFTHQLIRLAKYWYKSCSLDASVYGGSAIMEIICVTVVTEISDSVPMLEAFKMFLHKVCRLDSLKIAFIQVDGKWKLIPEGEMRRHADYFDAKIRSRVNYIIEPANPYNDMAQNISREVFIKLKKFAAIMVGRVEQLEATQSNKMITVSGQNLISIDFSKLFEPFPLVLSNEYTDGIPTEILVDYQYKNYHYNSAEPKLIVNKASFDSNKDAKNVTKAILNNLSFLIRAPKKKEVLDKKYISYTDGVANVSLDDVKDAIQRLTNENFKLNNVKASVSDAAHNGYDVTLYVPYRSNNQTFAVRISLKWPSGNSCVIT